jgi:hypothetical protein
MAQTLDRGMASDRMDPRRTCPPRRMPKPAGALRLGATHSLRLLARDGPRATIRQQRSPPGRSGAAVPRTRPGSPRPAPPRVARPPCHMPGRSADSRRGRLPNLGASSGSLCRWSWKAPRSCPELRLALVPTESWRSRIREDVVSAAPPRVSISGVLRTAFSVGGLTLTARALYRQLLQSHDGHRISDLATVDHGQHLVEGNPAELEALRSFG